MGDDTPVISDWISRVTIPDMYPRRSDPFRPAAAITPGTAPPPSMAPGVPIPPGTSQAAVDLYASLTTASQRPNVFQRSMNFTVTVPANQAVPLINQPMYCDTMVIDVYSTAANSVFFGFGSGVTVNSGIEIQPGLPIIIEPENTREQWELQRSLELLAAMIAYQNGVPIPGPYKSPRVVFNANEYFLVATAATAVSIMLFFVPEQQ